MYEVKYFLCAQLVSIDRDSNNISLFNVLEEASSPGFPLLIPHVRAVLALERPEKGDEAVNLTLHITQGDRTLETVALEGAFRSSKRLRLLLQMHGLVIEVPGAVKFSVRKNNGEELTSYSFDVERTGEHVVRAEA